MRQGRRAVITHKNLMYSKREIKASRSVSNVGNLSTVRSGTKKGEWEKGPSPLKAHT